MFKALLSIVSIQLVVGQAFACIGSGESFNISFRDGSNPGELIVNLRGSPSDSFQELVDDTGYVGVHLAVTHLAKEARTTKVKEISEPNETLTFLRSRVTYLDSYFSKHLDAATKSQFKSSLEKLKHAVNEKPVTSDELVQGISDLTGFFYQSKLEIMASRRNSASEPFSEEVPLSDIKLPTYTLSRSVGCNAGISGFNTSVSKSANPSGSAKRSRGANVTQ